MTHPPVGCIVHYHHPENDGSLAAIITWVHSDHMVNLCVFDPDGHPSGLTSVVLVQFGDKPPDHPYASWPTRAEILEGQVLRKDFSGK
jgi:hypothetical protein